MSKNTIYIILWFLLGVLVIGGLGYLLSRGQKRHFDSSITLGYKDKRPYGAFVAYQEFGRLFPQTPVKLGRNSEAFVKDLNDSDRNQLMFVLSPYFYPNTEEWSALVRWVRQGNYLVISAARFTQDVKEKLHVELSNFNEEVFAGNSVTMDRDDSLRISFARPPYPDTTSYFYPGRRLDRSLVSLDSSFTEVLGVNDYHYANMVRITAGDGAVILQTAPMAFSNYFLLYGDNMRYFDNFWSALPPSVHITKGIWSQYFLYKVQQDQRAAGFWDSILRLLHHPILGPAILALLLLLLVYVLLNLKRRQRIIPEKAPVTNESLEWVKTIGTMYYEKGDHRNLAVKMAQHFQEHIRTRYQTQLDPSEPSSVVRLASRAGVDEPLVRDIATNLRYVHDAPSLTADQLTEWYQLIEKFYKTAL